MRQSSVNVDDLPWLNPLGRLADNTAVEVGNRQKVFVCY
jgi:hypothetical protein